MKQVKNIKLKNRRLSISDMKQVKNIKLKKFNYITNA